MSFGPESHNPRERRAYADALIVKAKQTAALEDYDAAKKAVKASGTSRKSLASQYDQRLHSVALADKATCVIVTEAQKVLDPSQTPRTKLTWVGTKSDPKDLVSARRYSQNFSLVGRKGSTLGRTEVISPQTGEILVFTTLTATDHEGSRQPHVIPTDKKGQVDIEKLRRMPDKSRTELSRIVAKI